MTLAPPKVLANASITPAFNKAVPGPICASKAGWSIGWAIPDPFACGSPTHTHVDRSGPANTGCRNWPGLPPCSYARANFAFAPPIEMTARIPTARDFTVGGIRVDHLARVRVSAAISSPAARTRSFRRAYTCGGAARIPSDSFVIPATDVLITATPLTSAACCGSRSAVLFAGRRSCYSPGPRRPHPASPTSPTPTDGSRSCGLL